MELTNVSDGVSSVYGIDAVISWQDASRGLCTRNRRYVLYSELLVENKSSAICHLLGFETYWHFQFYNKILVLLVFSFETKLQSEDFEELVLFVLISNLIYLVQSSS